MPRQSRFEELVQNFKRKLQGIPEESHEAVMWWLLFRDAQKQRIAEENRLGQAIKIGKKVFWGSDEIPQRFRDVMMRSELLKVEVKKGKEKESYRSLLRKSEGAYKRKCEEAFLDTKWYNEVAIPAAEGERMGPTHAGYFLWYVGRASRFPSFGRIVKYFGLHVADDGQAPSLKKGHQPDWHPEGRSALYRLTESWKKIDKDEGSVWQARWDAWKVWYRENRPEILEEKSKKGVSCGDGHIENMARRKIQREFLRNLYELWLDYERDMYGPEEVERRIEESFEREALRKEIRKLETEVSALEKRLKKKGYNGAVETEQGRKLLKSQQAELKEKRARLAEYA